MKRYYLKANAKLNLYINVNYKNAQNYHDLTMLNVPINLYDTINVQIDENGPNIIELDILNNKDIPTNKENLVYKVVNHFKQIENLQFMYKCKIFKEIPIKSGTGGASSDAAQVILNLYKHFNLKYTLNELIEKYVHLGSDIAFFLYNKTAIVTGIGEKIKPITLNLKKFYFILIHPDFSQDTSEVYSRLDNFSKTKDNGKILNAINEIIQHQNFSLLKNDFLTLINNEKYDKIIDVLHKCGATYVSLTGTGSTVYGIVKKEINAKNLNNMLQKEFKNVFICQILGDSNE